MVGVAIWFVHLMLIVAVLVLTAMLLLMVVLTVKAAHMTRAHDREARRRSELVLLEQLSARELAELNRWGYLEVPSRINAGRAYRISTTSPRIVMVQDGVPVKRLCIGTLVKLPGREELVVHKLMLEADENDYLRRANVVWRTPAVRY